MAIAPKAIAPIAAAPRANAPTASARKVVLRVSIASPALLVCVIGPFSFQLGIITSLQLDRQELRSRHVRPIPVAGRKLIEKGLDSERR
jgi:hypothetical protein